MTLTFNGPNAGRDLTPAGLEYGDVFLVPQYTEVSSRSLVSTHVALTPSLTLDVPVISSNMDTVTEHEMAQAMTAGGGIGAIHRFMSIERSVEEYKLSPLCFVSVGVNEESRERAQELIKAGARHFIIDIAHGHSKLMRDMLEFMRLLGHEDLYLVAGNIATDYAALDLADWGADAIKVGIGPGAVCITKNVTGVTVPQFSAVHSCSRALKGRFALSQLFPSHSPPPNPLIIADGGITEIGDIAKALGAGADLVMSGRLFATCREAPGDRILGKKVYRGMASRDAMTQIRPLSSSLPTAEGVSTLLADTQESASEVCQKIKGGLQSAFSYANARNLKEFQELAVFGIRHNR